MRPIAKYFGVGAVVFALAAVLWGPVAVPALVKYPSHVDTTLQYTGTFTTYVDQATGIPLATPREAPLVIDRHVKSVAKQTTAHRAVVHETIDIRVAGQVIEHQDNQYVLDRKTMKNLDDPRAYAFVPTNKVNRAGTYAIQFPMNVKVESAQYPQWENQTGTTYEMRQAPGAATTKVDGLKVARFAGVLNPSPVSAFYAGALAKQGLPNQMTPAQLKATLKAKGVDADQALAGLAALLTPGELQTVQQVFSSPVNLHYVFFNNAQAVVEPKTGAPVAVTQAREGVGVVADLQGLQALLPILSKYDSVPAVRAAEASLAQMATAPPQTVFDMRFSQTPVSTAAVVKDVKANIRMMNVVKTYIRLAFAGLAIAFLIAALLTFRPHQPQEAVKTGELPWEHPTPKAA